MDDLSSKTCANDLGYHSICIEIKSLEKYFRKKNHAGLNNYQNDSQFAFKTSKNYTG